jgi:hypothetical protein
VETPPTDANKFLKMSNNQRAGRAVHDKFIFNQSPAPRRSIVAKGAPGVRH